MLEKCKFLFFCQIKIMNLLQLFPDVWSSTQQSFNISEGKSSQVGIIYTSDEKHENSLIIFYNF